MTLHATMQKVFFFSSLMTLIEAFSHPISISGPLSVPDGSSWSVPHDFASFSLPAHFFAEYAGEQEFQTPMSALVCAKGLTTETRKQLPPEPVLSRHLGSSVQQDRCPSGHPSGWHVNVSRTPLGWMKKWLTCRGKGSRVV